MPLKTPEKATLSHRAIMKFCVETKQMMEDTWKTSNKFEITYLQVTQAIFLMKRSIVTSCRTVNAAYHFLVIQRLQTLLNRRYNLTSG